jgi:5-methylcytosine-specific restriction endonuclease McrA
MQPESSPPVTKTCTKCQRELPADCFYPRRGRCSGLDAECKQCKKKRARDYRLAHLDEQRAVSRRWKQTHPERARELHDNWISLHPERQRHYAAAYYARHPDRCIASTLASRAKDPEKARVRDRRYVDEHRQERSDYARKYRAEHLDSFRAWASKRRATKRSAPDAGLSNADTDAAQLRRQRRRCYLCGQKIIGRNWHRDHIVPLSRDGTSDGPWNIIIACPTCNVRKHNKLPHEWSDAPILRLC